MWDGKFKKVIAFLMVFVLVCIGVVDYSYASYAKTTTLSDHSNAAKADASDIVNPTIKESDLPSLGRESPEDVSKQEAFNGATCVVTESEESLPQEVVQGEHQEEAVLNEEQNDPLINSSNKSEGSSTIDSFEAITANESQPKDVDVGTLEGDLNQTMPDVTQSGNGELDEQSQAMMSEGPEEVSEEELIDPNAPLAGELNQDAVPFSDVSSQEVDNSQYVHVDKTVKELETDNWELNLEAYATASGQSSTRRIPTDIILVLDNSGSMDTVMEKNGVTRLSVLKTVAKNFIKNLSQDAIDNKANHRVGIVKFASRGYYYQNGNFENGSNYDKTLYDLNTSTDVDSVTRAINSLSAFGATNTSKGMEHAKNILDYYNVRNEGKRNCAVVLITDGVPTTYSNFNESVANGAISAAKSIKSMNGLGGGKSPVVYSIGVSKVFDTTGTDTKIGEFMNYVSSNFKDAKSMKNPGERSSSNYFSTANSSTDLAAIMANIFENEINSDEIGLNEDTVLQDCITPYFNSVKASDVEVYTREASGNKDNIQWGELINLDSANVSLSDDGRGISITGFDYNEHRIRYDESGSIISGKKLVLKIKIKRDDAFFGGNQVPTNTTESGIYNQSECISKFPVPHVNVVLKYGLQSNNKSIYVSQDANGDMLGALEEKFQPNGTNNAFVDIKYQLLKDGNTIKSVEVLNKKGYTQNPFETNKIDKSNSAKYNIRAVITPTIAQKDYGELVIEKESSVFVFYPRFLCEDQTFFKGETVTIVKPYKTIEWYCTSKGAALPQGEAPQVNTTIQLLDGTSNTEIEPNSTIELLENQNFVINHVYVGNEEISNSYYTVIPDTECSLENHDENRHFTYHVKSGELLIRKQIDDVYSHNNRLNSVASFVFKIERFSKASDLSSSNAKPDDVFYEVITFPSNSSERQKQAKLVGLRKGYYRITEETNWSTSYQQNKVVDTDVNDACGNSNTNGILFIGNKEQDQSHYFGEAGTPTTSAHFAKISFENGKVDTSFLKDTAIAINKIQNK